MSPTQVKAEINRLCDELDLTDHQNNVLMEASGWITKLQGSLQQEVARIEKLQPLATAIQKAVTEYQS